MTEDEKLKELEMEAHNDRDKAIKSWYAYACELDVGEKREWAFDVYERIRTATRIHHD
jgi:hypothetical protein